MWLNHGILLIGQIRASHGALLFRDGFGAVYRNCYRIVRESLFRLQRNDTVLLTSFDTDTNEDRLATRQPGTYITRVNLPCPLLKSGMYSVSIGVGIANATLIQYIEHALRFEVELHSCPATFLGFADHRPGIVAVALAWKLDSNVESFFVSEIK